VKPKPGEVLGDGADKKLFEDECAYFGAYLHKAVMQALTCEGTRGWNEVGPEVMAALLYTLVQELIMATAATNVMHGDGMALVSALLDLLPVGVKKKTLRLRHEVDQIMESEDTDGPAH
jgi:hypothetical protein